MSVQYFQANLEFKFASCCIRAWSGELKQSLAIYFPRRKKVRFSASISVHQPQGSVHKLFRDCACLPARQKGEPKTRAPDHSSVLKSASKTGQFDLNIDVRGAVPRITILWQPQVGNHQSVESSAVFGLRHHRIGAKAYNLLATSGMTPTINRAMMDRQLRALWICFKISQESMESTLILT